MREARSRMATGPLVYLAEGVGFEPTRSVTPYAISRRAH